MRHFEGVSAHKMSKCRACKLFMGALAIFGILALVGRQMPIAVTLAVVLVVKVAIIFIKLNWLQQMAATPETAMKLDFLRETAAGISPHRNAVGMAYEAAQATSE